MSICFKSNITVYNFSAFDVSCRLHELHMNYSFFISIYCFINAAKMQIYRMIYPYFNMADVRNFKFSKCAIQLTRHWDIAKTILTRFNTVVVRHRIWTILLICHVIIIGIQCACCHQISSIPSFCGWDRDKTLFKYGVRPPYWICCDIIILHTEMYFVLLTLCWIFVSAGFAHADILGH